MEEADGASREACGGVCEPGLIALVEATVDRKQEPSWPRPEPSTGNSRNEERGTGRSKAAATRNQVIIHCASIASWTLSV